MSACMLGRWCILPRCCGDGVSIQVQVCGEMDLPAISLAAEVGGLECFGDTAVWPCRAGMGEQSRNGQKEQMLSLHSGEDGGDPKAWLV
jgi:hypothetical protein